MPIIRNGKYVENRSHAGRALSAKYHGEHLVWTSELPRLPRAYQEVEYIESNGESWLDTKIVFNHNTEIKVEFSLVYNKDGGTYILGGRKTFKDSDYTISLNDVGKVGKRNSLLNIYGSQCVATTSYLEDNTRYTVFKSKNKLYLDGNLVNTLEEENFTTPTTAYLFNVHITGTISAGNKTMVGKMYSCTIYDSGVCIGNFVPCYRKSDRKGGMYDTITNTFFPSVTNVDFIVGNKVKCKELKYIESNGNQYIDLHMIPKTTHSFSSKVKITDKNVANNMIIGSRTTGTFQTSVEQIYMNWQKVDKKIVLRNQYNVNDISITENADGYFEFEKIKNKNCQLTEPKQPYYMFALNKLGVADAFAYCRMFYFEIYDNGELLMNLIPYRIGTTVGLLDTLTKVFYSGELLDKPFTSN